MSVDVATIWIAVKIPGQKRFIIGGIYREHSIVAVPGSDNKRECQVTGDINLDYLEWGHPNYEHENMTELLKNNIETMGFHQLIETATRFWPNQSSTLLDHSWTNRPLKIVKTANISRSSSDHNVIITTIRTENCIEQQHNIRKDLEIISTQTDTKQT